MEHLVNSPAVALVATVVRMSNMGWLAYKVRPAEVFPMSSAKLSELFYNCNDANGVRIDFTNIEGFREMTQIWATWSRIQRGHADKYMRIATHGLLMDDSRTRAAYNRVAGLLCFPDTHKDAAETAIAWVTWSSRPQGSARDIGASSLSAILDHHLQHTLMIGNELMAKYYATCFERPDVVCTQCIYDRVMATPGNIVPVSVVGLTPCECYGYSMLAKRPNPKPIPRQEELEELEEPESVADLSGFVAIPAKGFDMTTLRFTQPQLNSINGGPSRSTSTSGNHGALPYSVWDESAFVARHMGFVAIPTRAPNIASLPVPRKAVPEDAPPSLPVDDLYTSNYFDAQMAELGGSTWADDGPSSFVSLDDEDVQMAPPEQTPDTIRVRVLDTEFQRALNMQTDIMRTGIKNSNSRSCWFISAVSALFGVPIVRNAIAAGIGKDIDTGSVDDFYAIYNKMLTGRSPPASSKYFQDLPDPKDGDDPTAFLTFITQNENIHGLFRALLSFTVLDHGEIAEQVVAGVGFNPDSGRQEETIDSLLDAVYGAEHFRAITAPHVLVVAIERGVADRQEFTPNKVILQEQIDFSRFVLDKEPAVYKMCSVIRHSSRPSHYVTHVRDGDGWNKYNDSQFYAGEAPPDNAVITHVFYQRVPFRPNQAVKTPEELQWFEECNGVPSAEYVNSLEHHSPKWNAAADLFIRQAPRTPDIRNALIASNGRLSNEVLDRLLGNAGPSVEGRPGPQQMFTDVFVAYDDNPTVENWKKWVAVSNVIIAKGVVAHFGRPDVEDMLNAETYETRERFTELRHNAVMASVRIFLGDKSEAAKFIHDLSMQ